MCCRGDISYTQVEHRGNMVLQPDGSAPEGEKRRKSSFSSPQQWTELAVVQGWDKWKYIRVEDEIILVWIWLGSLRKCWRWEYWQSSHLSYRRLAEQMAERSQKCFKYGTFFYVFFFWTSKGKRGILSTRLRAAGPPSHSWKTHMPVLKAFFSAQLIILMGSFS